MTPETKNVQYILANQEHYHVAFVTPLEVLSSEFRPYTGIAATKMLIQHAIDYHREYQANKLKKRGEWSKEKDLSDADHLLEFIALHQAIIVQGPLTGGTGPS